MKRADKGRRLFINTKATAHRQVQGPENVINLSSGFVIIRLTNAAGRTMGSRQAMAILSDFSLEIVFVEVF